jgi:phosphoribosyl 1,2-cyclic phosphodiesterase
VKATLWGTRGSIPSPGPDTVRYGGNTSCVEVRADDGTVLVLDAGTGVRRLGAELGEAGRVDLLLSHLHMDHVQGLGFFQPFFTPGVEVHLWGPSSSDERMRARLNRYLSPPLFPVRIRDLPCKLTIHGLQGAIDAPLDIGPFRIEATLICHPGATVGYRITVDGATLAYMPDHEPALGVPSFPREPEWTSGRNVGLGADVLIHDMQYTAAEYPAHAGWGHSSVEHAIAFARLCDVQRLLPFHHDPAHDDNELDALHAYAARLSDIPIIAGIEGTSLEL